MTPTILDGRVHAQTLKNKVRLGVDALKAKGIRPHLAAILVGDDPASHIYVKSKCTQCEEVGIIPSPHYLPASTTPDTLLSLLHSLNKDESVHGILLQLPLPAPLEANLFVETIAPHKDVDGLTTAQMGRLASGANGIVPCTPKGCLHLIKSVCGDDLAGLHAVVVGRSRLVGLPMALTLLREDATVSVVHIRTPEPWRITAQADILVVAAGSPCLVTQDWVKDGAVVIDVGITARLENGVRTLTGDVAFEEVARKAKAITPVPGGVGPMTVACLLENTLLCAGGTLPPCA